MSIVFREDGPKPKPDGWDYLVGALRAGGMSEEVAGLSLVSFAAAVIMQHETGGCHVVMDAYTEEIKNHQRGEDQ